MQDFRNFDEDFFVKFIFCLTFIELALKFKIFLIQFSIILF